MKKTILALTISTIMASTGLASETIELPILRELANSIQSNPDYPTKKHIIRGDTTLEYIKEYSIENEINVPAHYYKSNSLKPVLKLTAINPDRTLAYIIPDVSLDGIIGGFKEAYYLDPRISSDLEEKNITHSEYFIDQALQILTTD